MAKLGEDITRSFLEGLGLQVNKIKETDKKTPDFEVSLGEQVLFYCEEKTFEQVEEEYMTLEEMERYFDSQQKLQDYEFDQLDKDNTYDNMASRINTAINQFKYVNPNRDYPNVISITNYDDSKEMHDLFITLTGKAIIEDGGYWRIHRVGRIAEKLGDIDLFLWFDKDQYVGCIWVELNKTHDQELRTIFKD
jgi:mevalonate pyrophosphate decarboxylase